MSPLLFSAGRFFGRQDEATGCVLAAVREESNLLYVAVTRAKQKVCAAAAAMHGTREGDMCVFATLRGRPYVPGRSSSLRRWRSCSTCRSQRHGAPC